jgi:signal transduction histidine kinase
MSFRHRLALFLVVTLVAVQTLTAFVAYSYLRHDLVERGKRELTAAMGVITRQLDFLSDRVTDDVHVLSLDYALRSAIAQRDYGTELSALRNHGRRIGAARMLIVDLDARTSVDTGGEAPGKTFPYPELLQRAAGSNRGTALGTINGQVYWIVVMPVRAPVPIAFIAAYIPVNAALLNQLRTISLAQSSVVLATIGPNGRWTIAAQSSAHLHHIDLPIAPRAAQSSSIVTEDGKEFLIVTAPLNNTAGGVPVVAMLDYPLDEALGAYRGLVAPLLLALSIGLMTMLIGVTFIVRGVSRPLEMLSAAARRIATGDYTPPAPIAQRDEMGQLGDALIAMAKSISEREQALREAVLAMETAKNEAESANKAKSQFLSNMSHELRTPLNAVLGFSEMIREQVMGPVGVKRYADYASDIHDAGQHLLGLVERMLDLSEAEASRLTIKREEFSCGECMGSVVDSLREFAARSGVQLLCGGDFAKWGNVEGDAARLRQAFHNVVHNAIRFTGSGGSVRIEGGSRDGLIDVSVEDTGIGMDPELLATVTRPFHRLRSAFDGKNQGAGLGLPYAKVVFELHGGRLLLESAASRGTRVMIELPLAQRTSKAA